MNGNQVSNGSSKKLSRDQFIKMLDAALDRKSFRFGRQAALAWLAIYPGDLQVNLIQAKLLLSEGKLALALPILDRLARLDPEFSEVYRVIAQNTFGVDVPRYELAVTSLVALKEGRPAGPAVKEWGTSLRECRHLLDRGLLGEAKSPLKQVLNRQEAPILGKILHLKVISQSQDAQSLFRMADLYHTQSPECVQFNLYLADALMQIGNEPEAVNLLHRSMSMDASGQVAERLWGANHPYRSIWPESLVIHFEVAIPADVSGQLGWNWMLPSNSAVSTLAPVVEKPGDIPEDRNSQAGIPDLLPEANDSKAVQANGDVSALREAVDQEEGCHRIGSVMPLQAKEGPNNLREVGEADPIEGEFEKLARKLRRPAIGRADGRYPVYVVFSSKTGLEGQYGLQTAQILDVELRRLADAVRRRTGWEAIVYYPDDEKSATQQGVKVVKERDPWKLKLAIADLDKALAKRGLMIGMMVIVGGPQVVPFHELPNPTDDFDTNVNSDNPYATMDSNYFVPEWSIGRLPGSNSPDAALLLEQLRYLVAYHNHKSQSKGGKGIFAPMISFFESLSRFFIFRREKPNYGYTAAVWRRSSTAVFRPIGKSQHVMVSPPQVSGKVPVEKLLSPELSYFNLHGLADSGEWYGQRDPEEPGGGSDYPVALSPKELHRNGHSPRVVFSEACYGGYIQNKCEETALSLNSFHWGP